MRRHKLGRTAGTVLPDFSLAPSENPQTRDNRILDLLVRFLTVCLGMYGSAWTFFSAMDIWPEGSSLAVWMALYAAAAVAVYSSKNWPFLLLIPTAPLAIWAYFSFDTLTIGFISLLNQALQTMTENSPWRFIQFAMEPIPASELRWAETYFLVLLFCALTLGAGFFAVRRPWMPGFVLFTAPFALLPLFFTLLPDLWAFFALVASWIMMLALHQPLFRRKKILQKPGKVARQRNVRQQTALLLAGCVLVSALVSGWAVPQESYRRPEDLQELVGALESWGQRLFHVQNDLHHLPALRFTGVTALEVQSNRQDPLYLRGYAAGEFTGSTWEIMDDSEYEAFSSTVSEKINPQNLYAAYYSGEQQGYALTVRNISPNRSSLFLPSGLVTDISRLDGAWYRQDLYAETRTFWGVGEYTVQAYLLPALSQMGLHFADGTIPDWFQPTEETEGTTAFLENYEAFLYEPYTALPQDTRETAEAWWRQYVQEGENISLQEACTILQQVFNEDFQYRYDPPSFPQEREYLSWFLYDAQAGYCVHYATAGALLLRALGIPTRFAEGYIVTTDDYINGEKTSDGFVKITDDHAHAWVEVYDPVGRSWMPVEMTPGFSGESFWESPSGVAAEATPTPAPSEQPQATATPTPEPEATPTPKPQTEPTPEPQPTPTPPVQGNQQSTEDDFHLPGWVWPILAAAVCLALLIGGIFLHRKRLLEKQRKVWMQANVNLAVREYWKWTFRMLALIGAPIWENTDTLEEYADRLCAAFPELDRERLLDACRIGELASFSGLSLAEDQRNSMEVWAVYLNQFAISKMKPLAKLRGKWLFGLF